ncbi:MAG TPA: hypothetical protein VM328_07155 [Fimbriimonadaceae bacterium]|nr:hypothetical protein [Fimbriimonadaceae bacterium]
MTGASRAYLGAVVGALLTLAAHPVSRPYLLGPFLSWGPSAALEQSPWLTGNRFILPQPSTPIAASLWMFEAAGSIWKRENIGKSDLHKLVAVASQAGRDDPDNAFWPLMEAVFQRELGATAQADRAWLRASRMARFNDLQSSRLLAVRQEIAEEQGASQGWQYAAAHAQRSVACAHVLQACARWVLARASQNPTGLELRYATVMNGKLIRDGGRSLAVSLIGIEIMEAASYPADFGPEGSQKRLLLARYGLINALNERGMEAEAKRADTAYRNSDAWIAFAMDDEPDQWLGWLRVGALAASSAPGMLLLLGVVGSVLWGAGVLVARGKLLRAAFEPPMAPAVGILLALAVYMTTRLPLASATVVLCFAFLVFTPAHERTKPPTDLGPMFKFTLLLLGLAFALAVAGFGVGASTAGAEMLPLMNVPDEYRGGSTLFLGLAGIVLGLLLLAAPSWALVQRIATPTVVAIALRQFGAMLCLGFLTLAAVATPAAVYADRELIRTLRMLVENEPNYYILKQ